MSQPYTVAGLTIDPTRQEYTFTRFYEMAERHPDRDAIVYLGTRFTYRWLRDAVDRELIDTDALSMIEGVLQVSEMQVREIMIPRSQVDMLERDANPQQLLRIIVETVEVQIPYHDVSLMGGFFGTHDYNLAGTCSMRKEGI